MALAYGDVDFVDKTYQQGPGPDFDKTCWTEEKGTLGMTFPNLPYIMDGDMKISQSVACLTYACEKAGVHQNFTEQQKAEALSLAEHVMDIRNPAVMLFYGTYKVEGKLEQYVTRVKNKFQRMSDYLGKKDFLIGKEVCSADFHLAEMVYQHMLLEETIFDGMDNLKTYCTRFFELKGVKSVEEASAKKSLPMNNTQALFGGAYMPSPLAGMGDTRTFELPKKTQA